MSNSIGWIENLGSGSFELRQPLATDIERVQTIRTADFNTDGLLDIVAGYANGIAWFEGLGSSQFGEQRNIATSVGSHAIDAADLDGDGLQVVYLTSYGDIDVDGDVDSADLQAVFTHFTGAQYDGPQLGWQYGDMDGDGDVDTADLHIVITRHTGDAEGL